MRTLIVTAGSRGDVAPFTGLGQRLRDAGHQVTLAAHETFAGLVRGCGLEYRPLPGDPRDLVRARTAASSAEEARSQTIRFLEAMGDAIIAAAGQGADVVLTALGPAPLSRLAAEAAGVPTGEFALPGLPQLDQTDPAANLAAGHALLAGATSPYAGILPKLRDRLGLPAEPAGGADGAGSAWPACHGFSPLVVPRPADWPPAVEVSGYWWPARPEGWQPPRDLVDFLAAGPPPVFIGFGSMAPDQGERLSRVIEDAVTRAGVAPEPVSFENLTAGTLGDALRECLGKPGYRERAASLGRRIADEDGAAAVLARIERLAAAG